VFRKAKACDQVKRCEAAAVELKKANTKQLKAAATLYNKKIAEEKRVVREKAKVVRDQEKAKKAAATTAKKAAQNTKKTLPTA
jgi:hypothetical protein